MVVHVNIKNKMIRYTGVLTKIKLMTVLRMCISNIKLHEVGAQIKKQYI